MQIIDAHHHIWRQADLTWLSGPIQPRIFGDYTSIQRDYPVAEFVQDLAGTGVEKSVYVQANWPVERYVDEVAWVQKTADEAGWPHGIVGYCDMTVPDARAALDKLKGFPLMRGIRQQFHWHENPQYRFAPTPDLCRDPVVQRNVGHLAAYGWSFELQVFADQMDGACELAAACPNVTFILQHAGMLVDLSDTGCATWKRQMQKLAQQTNVVSKLSAFGTFIHRNDPAHIARIVQDTVAIFGPERCLYGSNFPIEKIWTPYRPLLDAFLQATKDMGEGAQRAIFCDTAKRVYRL
jgi:predicted TIM-barrel fold metal-dependent hydrolase